MKMKKRYCFGNYVYDEYEDDFSNYDYEKAYEIIQSRMDEYRACREGLIWSATLTLLPQKRTDLSGIVKEHCLVS